MVFLIAFAVIALALVALSWYERRKRLHTSSDESDTYAMTNGAAFGGTVAQAQMSKMGIQGDEITVREDLEPVKFKFED
jgi:hypothetical protein